MQYGQCVVTPVYLILSLASCSIDHKDCIANRIFDDISNVGFEITSF